MKPKKVILVLIAELVRLSGGAVLEGGKLVVFLEDLATNLSISEHRAGYLIIRPIV